MKRNRFLILGLTLLIMGDVLAVSAIFTVIAQSLHILLNAKAVASVMTSYTLAVMCGKLFFGKWTDSVGAKRLLRRSLPLMAVILCGYPLTQGNTLGMTAVAVGHGLSYALVTNTIFLVTRRSVSKPYQPRISALAGACVQIGSGMAMPVALRLAKTDFLWNVVLVMGFSAVFLVYTGLALIDKYWVTYRQKMRNWVRRLSAVHRVKGFIHRDAFLLGIPTLGFTAANLSFLTWFMNSWSEQPDLVLLLANVVNALAAFTVMPWLAKHRKAYLPLVGGSNILMVVCLFLIWQAHSLWVMIIAGTFIGIAVCGSSLGITEAILHKVNENQQGAATSTYGFLQLAGNAFGVAYSSMMWENFERGMWLTMIPLPVCSLVALLIIWKRSGKVDKSNKVYKPLPLLSHLSEERLESASSLADGRYEQYAEFLSDRGIDGLIHLPPYSQNPEDSIDFLRNIVEVLVFLEMVKQKAPDLPSDGPSFELQEQLLKRLLDLKPTEVEAYASEQKYEDPVHTEIEIRKFFAYLMRRIRLFAKKLENAESSGFYEGSDDKEKEIKPVDTHVFWDRDK